jgi:hypothetical protein
MIGYTYGDNNSDTPISAVLGSDSFVLSGVMVGDRSPVSAEYVGWTTLSARSMFRAYLRGKIPTPYGN